VAWLVTESLEVIAMNDDGGADTQNALIQAELPAAGGYFILVRDYDLADATIEVNLAGQSAEPSDAPSLEGIQATYNALVDAGTLAEHADPAAELPAAPRSLHDKWVMDAASVPGLEVSAYSITVEDKRAHLVRKYLPGQGMELAAFSQGGVLLGIAGGTGEHIDQWSGL
jgi:hypothetical protein